MGRPDLEWSPGTAYAQTYGVPTNLNQTPSQNGTGMTWNDAGNLTAFGSTTYEWTFGNRLARVLKPGATTEYAYDSQDRRTVVIEDGVMTRTLWSGADEVGEYDAAGGLKRRFIPDGSGSMDARLATVNADGTIYWHHTDHQGSVIGTSNAAGHPVQFANYSPHGKFGTDVNGNTYSAPPTGSPFGYTGRQWDARAGLYQYRARYYLPEAGIFLSMDPIGTKDDPNLYGYVAQDPVNRTDPTGLAGRGNLSGSEWNRVKSQQDKALAAVRGARAELMSYLKDPSSDPEFANRFASFGGDVTNSEHVEAYAGRLAFVETVLSDDGSNYNYARGGASTERAATVRGQNTIVLNSGFFADSGRQATTLIHEPQHFRNSAGYNRNPPVDDQDISTWISYSNGRRAWGWVQANGPAQARELARQSPATAIYNPENVAQMVATR